MFFVYKNCLFVAINWAMSFIFLLSKSTFCKPIISIFHEFKFSVFCLIWKRRITINIILHLWKIIIRLLNLYLKNSPMIDLMKTSAFSISVFLLKKLFQNSNISYFLGNNRRSNRIILILIILIVFIVLFICILLLTRTHIMTTLSQRIQIISKMNSTASLHILWRSLNIWRKTSTSQLLWILYNWTIVKLIIFCFINCIIQIWHALLTTTFLCYSQTRWIFIESSKRYTCYLLCCTSTRISSGNSGINSFYIAC